MHDSLEGNSLLKHIHEIKSLKSDKKIKFSVNPKQAVLQMSAKGPYPAPINT